MQLQTKKQEISYTFEKYQPDHQRLHKALESLKAKNIDESLIQQSDENEYIFGAFSGNREENKAKNNIEKIINSGSTASNEEDDK